MKKILFPFTLLFLALTGCFSNTDDAPQKRIIEIGSADDFLHIL